MRQHEAWAREGKLWDESKGRPAGLDMEGGETARGTMIDRKYQCGSVTGLCGAV
ncbi:Na+/H+ antiporter [Vibrio cholerae]|nr:Na+/H+ antiporter [Vibrio cholerae]